MRYWSLALLFLSSMAFAKQQLVFLINASETDVMGGKTADYIDEHYDQKILEKIFPQAKVVRIRVSTDQQLTEKLKFWMQPDPEEKEVAGLFISSHGSRMFLSNEKRTFQVRIPFDIPYTFAPIIGRFAPNARIIFNGCQILSGKDKRDSVYALESILDAFKIENGSVYANQTVGLFLFKMWSNTDPLNPEIVMSARIVTAIFYSTWFLALPIAYVEERIANRGYILNRIDNESYAYKATYFDSIKPEIDYRALKRVR